MRNLISFGSVRITEEIYVQILPPENGIILKSIDVPNGTIIVPTVKKRLQSVRIAALFFIWWRCRDLNPGLCGYEPHALTS